MRGQRDLVNGVLFDPDFMLVAEVRAGTELEVASINALENGPLVSCSEVQGT